MTSLGEELLLYECIIFMRSSNSLMSKQISRKCVIPIGWDVKRVYDYIKKSIKSDIIGIKIKDIQKALYLEGTIEEFETASECSIDYYWNDAHQYIVEMKDRNKRIGKYVIAGFKVSKADVKNLFEKNYKEVIVDYWSDCWTLKSLDKELISENEEEKTF